MRKILVALFVSIFSIVMLTVLLFVVSPVPTSMLIHKLFEGGMAVEPANYAEIEQGTRTYQDVSYQSVYQDGDLDIITPKEFEGKLPVIFWVHGGAFLGGDKADITEYAVQIANEGYIVVNLNYELAPSAKYPTPLLQVSEAYSFIMQEAATYGMNMDRVYFAGDSAGAQIVSQFVNVQVEPSYAKVAKLEAIVLPETIEGVLLFCGPYDVTRFGEISDNALVSFLFRRVGWAYIGDRNWLDSDEAKEASIIEYVSESFPPTFITDGNTGSFEDQGIELTQKLKDNGVFVQDIFYSTEEAELGHEYQFVMNTPQAENTFQEMMAFLKTTQGDSEER